MSWYETEEEALEACKWKEERYGCEFHVIKERTQMSGEDRDIYWAQRIIEDKRSHLSAPMVGKYPRLMGNV